jgi:hypothetical protein
MVADKDCEQLVGALLKRHQALGIRQVASDIIVNPDHDSGCRLQAPDFLRPFHRRYDHALVIFDREGCGIEDQPRETIESQLEEQLARNGWNDRATVIAIEPELESWVWSQSPNVGAVLGWANRSPSLREWLEAQGFMIAPDVKPERPKEAMDEAVRVVGKPHSSSLFRLIAEKVSVTKCTDPAFTKLRGALRGWFPAA